MVTRDDRRVFNPGDVKPLSIAAASALAAGLGFGVWLSLPGDLAEPQTGPAAELIDAVDPNLAKYRQVIEAQGIRPVPYVIVGLPPPPPPAAETASFSETATSTDEDVVEVRDDDGEDEAAAAPAVWRAPDPPAARRAWDEEAPEWVEAPVYRYRIQPVPPPPPPPPRWSRFRRYGEASLEPAAPVYLPPPPYSSLPAR